MFVIVKVYHFLHVSQAEEKECLFDFVLKASQINRFKSDCAAKCVCA